MANEIEKLTSNQSIYADKSVRGSGIFDDLMESVNVHIEAQYKAGRITGTDYATVYLGAMQHVISQSVEIFLNKELQDQKLAIGEKELIKVTAEADRADDMWEYKKLILEKEKDMTISKDVILREEASRANTMWGYKETILGKEKDITIDKATIVHEESTQAADMWDYKKLILEKEKDMAISKDTMLSAEASQAVNMWLYKKTILEKEKDMATDKAVILNEEANRAATMWGYKENILKFEKDITEDKATITGAEAAQAIGIWANKALISQHEAAIASAKKTILGAEASQAINMWSYKKNILQYESINAQTFWTNKLAELTAKKDLVIEQKKAVIREGKQRLLKQALDSWSVAYSVSQGEILPNTIKKSNIDNITRNIQSELNIVTTGLPF